MQNFGVTNKEDYGMLRYFGNGQYSIDSGLFDGHDFNRWYICLERRPLRLTVSLRNGVPDYLIKMAEFPAKTERRKRKTYCPIAVMNFLKSFCLKNTYSLCPQTAPKNRPKF